MNVPAEEVFSFQSPSPFDTLPLATSSPDVLLLSGSNIQFGDPPNLYTPSKDGPFHMLEVYPTIQGIAEALQCHPTSVTRAFYDKFRRHLPRECMRARSEDTDTLHHQFGSNKSSKRKCTFQNARGQHSVKTVNADGTESRQTRRFKTIKEWAHLDRNSPTLRVDKRAIVISVDIMEAAGFYDNQVGFVSQIKDLTPAEFVDLNKQLQHNQSEPVTLRDDDFYLTTISQSYQIHLCPFHGAFGGCHCHMEAGYGKTSAKGLKNVAYNLAKDSYVTRQRVNRTWSYFLHAPKWRLDGNTIAANERLLSAIRKHRREHLTAEQANAEDELQAIPYHLTLAWNRVDVDDPANMMRLGNRYDDHLQNIWFAMLRTKTDSAPLQDEMDKALAQAILFYLEAEILRQAIETYYMPLPVWSYTDAPYSKDLIYTGQGQFRHTFAPAPSTAIDAPDDEGSAAQAIIELQNPRYSRTLYRRVTLDTTTVPTLQPLMQEATDTTAQQISSCSANPVLTHLITPHRSQMRHLFGHSVTIALNIVRPSDELTPAPPTNQPLYLHSALNGFFRLARYKCLHPSGSIDSIVRIMREFFDSITTAADLSVFSIPTWGSTTLPPQDALAITGGASLDWDHETIRVEGASVISDLLVGFDANPLVLGEDSTTFSPIPDTLVIPANLYVSTSPIVMSEQHDA